MKIDTDNKEELRTVKKELERELRRLDPKPAKDIVTHKMLTDEEKYKDIKWAHKLTAEFARYLGQINDDIKNGSYDKKVLDELFREIKTLRDRRFMTSEAKMRAIIIAAATVTSLKHAVDGVNVVVPRWELASSEQKCTKCFGLSDCKSTRCTCVCHDIIKKGTTKGIKWHMDTHEHCRNLYDKLEIIANHQPKDVCDIGSDIIDNYELNDFMEPKVRLALMRRHLSTDKCTKCTEFVNNSENKWLFTSNKPKREG